MEEFKEWPLEISLEAVVLDNTLFGICLREYLPVASHPALWTGWSPADAYTPYHQYWPLQNIGMPFLDWRAHVVCPRTFQTKCGNVSTLAAVNLFFDKLHESATQSRRQSILTQLWSALLLWRLACEQCTALYVLSFQCWLQSEGRVGPHVARKKIMEPYGHCKWFEFTVTARIINAIAWATRLLQILLQDKTNTTA